MDYHHGNGTQDIFYDRDDVQFISLHADPASDYPYFLGYADETGERQGRRLQHQLSAAAWHGMAEVERGAGKRLLAGRTFAPDVLIVSLGVDTYKDDPISGFKLESEHYLRIGERIASLKLPTVYLMEGGYAIDAIGVNIVNTLSGHLGRS